jgi:molybdopterin-guanine dinucleotide biosynthesis protein B
VGLSIATNIPIALGIAGYSGSGKTTLVTTLLPALIDRGLTVATLKRSHHGFDIFPADHLVNKLRDAGASEVLIAGATNWALMRNAAEEPNPPLTGLLSQCAGSDLVLIEGFKHQPIPKIEIWRPETGVPLLAPADPYIVAIATTAKRITQLPKESPTPVLDLNDMGAIAGFIMQYCADHTCGTGGRRPR